MILNTEDFSKQKAKVPHVSLATDPASCYIDLVVERPLPTATRRQKNDIRSSFEFGFSCFEAIE